MPGEWPSIGLIVPSRIGVLPILSRGRVFAILYGDQGTKRTAAFDTQSLEIFLSQAGLAIENTLLQRELESLSRKRETPL